MAYNSKYTGAQVEALLDRAGAAPQTYDIGWLMDLISTSGNGIVTLTAEQFNEVKAAYDAGKIFVSHGQVFSSSAFSNEDGTFVILRESSDHFVTSLTVASLTGAYKATIIRNQIITQDDLTSYAKSSDIPTKTSQLTNDSGYLTEHQSIKTINGESIVGTGDLTIQAGSAGGLEYESVNNTESEYSVAPVIGKLIDLTGVSITKMTIEVPGNIADVANGPLKSNIAIVRFKSGTDLTFVHSSAYKFIKGDTSIEIADNVYYEIVITPISVSSASNYKFGLSYAYYV